MNKKALFLPLAALYLSGCVDTAPDASAKSDQNVGDVQGNVPQVQQENKQGAVSTPETAAGITVISPDELLQKVISAKRAFATGWSSSTGMWIISRQKVRLKGNMSNQDALNVAEIRAKKRIAEFMGSNVSARDEAYMAVDNSDGRKQFKQSFSSLSVTNVNQFLRGVTLLKAVRKDDVIFASFYVTGKMVDATEELEKQLRKAPPGTVRASGYAIIVNGRIPPAKQAALQIALRNAVEQVMGTTVVGRSSLMNNATMKSKIISQTLGSIKRYRIVKEGIAGINYQVIAVCEIDPKHILDNYSSLVRSMGNPGFFINTEDPDLKTALSDFMRRLGCKVEAASANAPFIVDAGCTYLPINDEHYGQGLQIDLHIRLLNKKTGEVYFAMQNKPRLTSTFSGTYHQIRQNAAWKAFKSIKQTYHEKLNRVIVDWVTNGREIDVIFDHCSGEYAKLLEPAIDNVPGAKIISKSQNNGTVIFKCQCICSSSDFEDFFREALGASFAENPVRLNTRSIGADEIRFDCVK